LQSAFYIKKDIMKEITLVEKAKAYAIGLHNGCGHTYNDGPYEFHLQMVVDKVRAFKKLIHAHPYYGKKSKYAEALEAAAWCHDTIEDCGITYNDLKAATSKLVADIVYGVSDEIGIDRTERRLKTLARTRQSPLCVMLKLCDLYSNTSFSKESGSGMFKKYKKEYPMVRYALNNGEDWQELWLALDDLYDYGAVLEWLNK
jgi:(p)ppGpp synthase/HD superfamily hydrolase